MKVTRRQFLKGAAVAGVAVAAGGSGVLLRPGQALAINNSDRLAKWIQAMRQLAPLARPGVDNATSIPILSTIPDSNFPGGVFAQVTVSEFTDQLHPGLPNPTHLWGYSDTTTGAKIHLGGVALVNRGTPIRMRFTNALKLTAEGLPIVKHIIPVDATLAGANQAVNRTAVHLHGGFVSWDSDGGPFDWWAPTGASGQSFKNGPGSHFDIGPLPMVPGQADYYYPNDQSFRLSWYHDHAHGITRVNAYAGVASGYLILDTINAAYTGAGLLPPLTSTFPLVFQDKTFVSSTTIITDPSWFTVADARVQLQGNLWYEHVYNPKEFRLLKNKKVLPPPDPSAIPEFFGDTMLCNGLVYPYVQVEAKRYRFVVLNACNARFLNINLLEVAVGTDVTTNPKTGFAVAGTPLGPPITQIGTEGGFLVAETSFPNGLPFNPATLAGNLLLGPAERADIIIDFTGLAGKEFMMYNDAPGPFPAGPPTTDYYLGNPKNPIQPLAGTGPDTRNILKFKVVNAPVADPQPAGPILNPNLLDPAPIVPYTTTVAPIPPLVPPAGAFLRNLTLNEDFDGYGRLRQLLGTNTPGILPGFGREYLEPATEMPAAGSTEVWNVFNLTADTHPIHFHLVNVQVLSRQPFKVVNGVFAPTGVARGPEPNELGWKETVQMHPGEVTSVVMKFDLPAVPFNIPFSTRLMGGTVAAPAIIPNANEYVWHCHILEHEEHDMMRPLVVTGAPLSVTLAQEVKGATGGTVSYLVTNETGGITVTSSDPVKYPATVTPTGFDVTVAAGAATPTIVIYTITAGAAPPQTATARLYIV